MPLNTIYPALRRLLPAAAVSLVVLVGCSGETNLDKMSKAFCSDLEAGYTPFQILQGGDKTGQDAADEAYVMAERSCPEQLESNEALRSYLENWGINPTA